MAGEASQTVEQVQAAIDKFKRILREECRADIELSDEYRMVECLGKKPHWPQLYKNVWNAEPGVGVYLIFDQQDRLIYVGKSECIGRRLGNYFAYARSEFPVQERRSECEVVDSDIKQMGGAIVRAVLLGSESEFSKQIVTLAPALESFLIAELNPPVNKQGRTDKRK